MGKTRPVCFVIMPFGLKRDPRGGADIDFDRIYEEGVRPAVEAADMEPVRADEERVGGIIHRAVFERLLLCDFAIADLTTADANVFYALGVRHAVRPATTLAICAGNRGLSCDDHLLRALPYDLAAENRFGEQEAQSLIDTISHRLKALRSMTADRLFADSPVFQLLADHPAPEISRRKTDRFREQLAVTCETKRELATARNHRDAGALRAICASLDPEQAESAVLVDLFLSFRALSMWTEMVKLYERMPVALQRAVMMREQLGFAQNRLRDREAAIRTLEQVIEEQGPSSEACGILGRVYKDLWGEASAAGDTALADHHLSRAIEVYEQGFRADCRDAYPGINALTLLDIQGDTDTRDELLPVVSFSARQRIGAQPDYWDHATMLELAVLGSDEADARARLRAALRAVREPWEPESTANNLKLIRGARVARGVIEPWLDEVVSSLEARSH